MKRGDGPKQDPEKTRAWQRRSQDKQRQRQREAARDTAREEKPRARIKPFSDKKLAEMDEHAEVREAVFKRDGRKCRLAPFFPDVKCGGPLTVHHIEKASAGGEYVEDNLVTACAVHNDLVEDRPDEAEAMGLVRRTAPWTGPKHLRPAPVFPESLLRPPTEESEEP